MKEYFEHAYEGFINLTEDFYNIVRVAFEFFCIVLIYVTVPFWALPYAIYKKSRKDKENGN